MSAYLLKDGESLMDAYKRVAEHYQLPIYDTEGNILWPRNKARLCCTVCWAA